MHAVGIVHRDLNLGNIVLLAGEGDRVKLLDTGIAKLLPKFYEDVEIRTPPEKRLRTQPGAPLGTPGYMAPEAVLGAEASPAQDIYGLGVTIFRLATGRLPYHELLPPGPGDEPRWSAELERPIPRALEVFLKHADRIQLLQIDRRQLRRIKTSHSHEMTRRGLVDRCFNATDLSGVVQELRERLGTTSR